MEPDRECNNHRDEINKLQNCAEKMEEYTNQIRELIKNLPAPTSNESLEENRARTELYNKKRDEINGIITQMENCKK